MKTLYVQCNMGAAGDMLMAALLELLPESEQQAFLSKINGLGIPGVQVSAGPSVRGGVTGTHVRVLINGEEELAGEDGHDHHHDHDHHHHENDHHHDHDHDHDHDHEHDHGHDHVHNGMREIRGIIQGLDVSEKVKGDALAVYDLIAQAEAQVHGESPEHIHFHEVGSLDAVTDVVGNCMLLETIGADRIAVSPIHVGSGTVRCAHGVLPVPAPATALILQGMPIYSGQIQSELCTPTGAALLRHFGQAFGPMPAMTIEKMGYGMGNKEFPEAANCVRVILGEAAESGSASGNRGAGVSDDKGAGTPGGNCKDGSDASVQSAEHVYELACNLDDMTGEDIGFAMEQLLRAGALDVYTQPITMKKSRPAVKLSVLTRTEDRQKMAELLFRHTTTVGIRVYDCERYVLHRYFAEKETPLGPVSVKVCEGYGVKKEKPEMDKLAELAREKDLSMSQVRAIVEGKDE